MNPHTQDLNEMIAVLNARLESRHIEATEQAGQIGDLKRELEQSQAEVERLLKLTATCTCGTPGLDYEGPQPACMVHGAVRAYHEAQAAIERVRNLHWSMTHGGITICGHCSGWNGFRCRGVVQPHPCPTLADLDVPETLGGES